ncbi:hypothetical protein ORJ66_03890 [Pseudoalteromonas tunicata]|uniref:hypothetical protein n=1 Tax=Pseudoalteromonas tunicata TaxID=314281 RepID=UPI00273E3777|nr:hypothetical protein [Pseudoalteromonas tunicata]MDP5212185.1 hypothetical protein [Pseudoalteromonas tunicata]
MKSSVLKSILFSLLSPLIIGSVIGIYYCLSIENADSKLFFSILMTALSNAHIVGLTMAVCVVPLYLYLAKRQKVTYSSILTVGMLGGAVFSSFLSANMGEIFLVNTVMSLFAAGLFLYTLRRTTPQKL